MNSNELARRLAAQERITRCQAEAQLDQLARDIRRLLQSGHSVELPGLGRFEPGPELKFHFETPPAGRSAGKRQAAGKRRG
ncbi:MAG: HU family DNA-binding protein [Bryobacterales bacterium]|nr:HU family DNA-binding protein [Bryobacterales bacterium]